MAITEWPFGAKMTSYQRQCDVVRRIDVNTSSFLRHVPTGYSGGRKTVERLRRICNGFDVDSTYFNTV